MMTKTLKKLSNFSENEALYTAYPFKERRVAVNAEAINIDTFEINQQISGKITTNSSANL